MMDSDAVKELMKSLGADLCGIASIERFADAPKGYHPIDIFPECKSVISFAVRFPVATLRCNSPIPYTLVRNTITPKMNTMALDFCIEMEKRGVLCVPIPTNESQWDSNTERWRSIISQKHAAQAAGLGTIGRNSLLITPEYGSMVWLGAVLCELELQPDELKEDICDNCNLCVESCPVNALADIEMNQQACWDYAFGDDEETQVWRISCHRCRDICPHNLGNRARKTSECKNNLKIQGKYIGIDGCKGGWIAAILDPSGLRIEKYSNMENLVKQNADFSECLVDMVIGLQEKATDVRPDGYARTIISKRASTIFPAPCRQAVYAQNVSEKYDINEKILGKKFTPLTLGIMPKMREMDEFFENNPMYKNVIKESHPEVCFSRLLGECIMSKKNTTEGVLERIDILSQFIHIDKNYLWKREKEIKCNLDDIIDAICLAVTSALAHDGKGEVIPPEPMEDAKGLLMQMVIPKL